MDGSPVTTSYMVTPNPASSRWARILVSLCSLLFGVSAWVSVNGLWVQMPLLVPVLPEGWNLGSVLVIVIQVANVGPLVYTLARNYLGIRPSVHATLFVGLAASVLMVFFWRHTVGEHSVAFIALAFLLACVDCTSSVLYMPFMARYPPRFLFWYMVGEGLSGLVPATIALAQGVGEQTAAKSGRAKGPRFSVEVFLSMLAGIVAISWIAFIALAHCQVATALQVRENKKGQRYGAADNHGYEPENGVATVSSQSSVDGVPPSSGESSSLNRQGRLKRSQWWLVLSLQALIACLGNGVLLAIQTYSSLPYGQLAYHLATNLAVIANPVSCSVAALLPLKSLGGLVFITAGGLGCAAYILLLAVQSPNPILVGTAAGAAIMVSSWVLFVSLTTFVKCRLAAGTMAHGGARSLMWYGVATQGGSFSGAMLMFVLTNYTHIFKSA